MSFERKKSKNGWLIVIILFLILGGIIMWVSWTIRENHLQEDPMLWKLKEMLTPLHSEVKQIKLYKGDKSYTINKEKIYLCLKDEKDQYYPTNHLVYVLIHELAHLLNKDDIGHTPKFHSIFEDLLDKAHKLEIYNPSIPPTLNYCNY
jgi:hypothetical protein